MTERPDRYATGNNGLAELPPEVTAQVVTDFVLTFRYSQGDEDTHRKLIDGITAFYDDTFDEPLKENLRMHIDELHDSMVDTFQVPTAHFPVLQTRGREQVDGVRDEWWGKFSNKIIRLTRPTPPLSADALDSLAYGLVTRDTEYQAKPRPGREALVDPHYSLTRRHIVLGRKSGSAAIDSLFQGITPLIFDPPHAGLQEDVETLEAAWEDNHPGEKFFATENGDYNN